MTAELVVHQQNRLPRVALPELSQGFFFLTKQAGASAKN